MGVEVSAEELVDWVALNEDAMFDIPVGLEIGNVPEAVVVGCC